MASLVALDIYHCASFRAMRTIVSSRKHSRLWLNTLEEPRDIPGIIYLRTHRGSCDICAAMRTLICILICEGKLALVTFGLKKISAAIYTWRTRTQTHPRFRCTFVRSRCILPRALFYTTEFNFVLDCALK